MATHSIRQFPLHFPSCASPSAITFQLDSTSLHIDYVASTMTMFVSVWKGKQGSFLSSNYFYPGIINLVVHDTVNVKKMNVLLYSYKWQYQLVHPCLLHITSTPTNNAANLFGPGYNKIQQNVSDHHSPSFICS